MAKKQVIFMVGNSRGAKHGDRRSVDTATAERLVRAGLARYPANKADQAPDPEPQGDATSTP